MLTTYESLSDSTRVWIYQSSRPFSAAELETLLPQLHQFTQQWVSHNQDLKAFAEVYHERFIVLMVDESQAGASGCSIDKSVYYMKQLEAEYQINLFDRLTFSFKDGDEIRMAPKEEFAALYREGKINDRTLVFDNLVKNKSEFESRWMIPLEESWHKRMV